MKINIKESTIKYLCQVFNKKYIAIGEVYPENTTIWVFESGVIPRVYNVNKQDSDYEYRREEDEMSEDMAEIFGYTTKGAFYASAKNK